MTNPAFQLRPARSTDAGKIGEILHRFATDTPWMPNLYTGAETIGFCGQMIDRGWVMIGQHNHEVKGFLARDEQEICALYIHPDFCGHGLGRALLDHAKSCSAQLELWTFQANTGAQRFCEREGFHEQERTEGARNEEQLPDMRYRWPGASSAAVQGSAQ
ncbi:GNAT family N-acetyltransferase [Phaeobacter sp.]|uniref:GNAT family N-acetyltransferase n=1 Tax=Phaeobacter sp. TaxID=1902409 RepID=UPI0025E94A7B|nr:GNAT family N-acetyltransferase [Phaeobacter sp.]